MLAKTESPARIRWQHLRKTAARHLGIPLANLIHLIDLDWLHLAFQQLNKDARPGVDGIGYTEFHKGLDGNLGQLWLEIKSGCYRPSPIRRARIAKGDGTKRPLGIPTTRDRVLQWALQLLFEAILTPESLPCSFAYQADRSAHDALQVIWRTLTEWNGAWVIDADIRDFFGSMDHGLLISMLSTRIKDRHVLKLVTQVLKSKVSDFGKLKPVDRGSPQGGIISPTLSNMYLHDALDTWFHRELAPQLQDDARLVRYADDFVILCKTEGDAHYAHEQVDARLKLFRLELHPEKTHIVPIFPPTGTDLATGLRSSQPTFSFLGFTYGQTWVEVDGHAIPQPVTSDISIRKSLLRLQAKLDKRKGEWKDCRPTDLVRRATLWLGGYYAYFDIPGNLDGLKRHSEALWPILVNELKDRKAQESHFTQMKWLLDPGNRPVVKEEARKVYLQEVGRAREGRDYRLTSTKHRPGRASKEVKPGLTSQRNGIQTGDDQKGPVTSTQAG